MHIPFFNYQIYEKDIIILGGTVEYYADVSSSCRSELKDAHVSLPGVIVDCRMELFKDGSSVIRSFLLDGKPKRGNLFPEARTFLKRFFERLEQVPEQVCSVIVQRTLFQYVLGIFQILFFVLFVMNLYKVFTHISLRHVAVLFAIICLVFIYIIGRFYTVLRSRYMVG